MVNASGFVNLLSSTYPGPGFTGQYQMAGDLTLTPNPFKTAAPQLLATPAADWLRLTRDLWRHLCKGQS